MGQSGSWLFSVYNLQFAGYDPVQLKRFISLYGRVVLSFQIGNSKTLTGVKERFIKTPELIQEMGRQSLAVVEEMYDQT